MPLLAVPTTVLVSILSPEVSHRERISRIYIYILYIYRLTPCFLPSIPFRYNAIVPLVGRPHAGEIFALQFGGPDGLFVSIESPQASVGTVSVPTYPSTTLSVVDHR